MIKEDLKNFLHTMSKEVLIECIETFQSLKIKETENNEKTEEIKKTENIEENDDDDCALLKGLILKDITIFYEKNAKGDNDKCNKKREAIVLNILTDKIPKKWYSFTNDDKDLSKKWYTVAFRLKEYIKKLQAHENVTILKHIIQKAGRNYNYDFDFIFVERPLKIELKNGVKSIVDYPEIISVPANKFIIGVSYAEYYYDVYLTQLGIESLPSKEVYLKNVYKTDIKHEFFRDLKNYEGLLTIVYDSISSYLENIIQFDFDAYRTKISEQSNKIFMLWKNEEFHLDKISVEDVDIIPEKNLKRGSHGYTTIVIKTHGVYEHHVLLRWKNTNGVLLPAWQVKLFYM